MTYANKLLVSFTKEVINHRLIYLKFHVYEKNITELCSCCLDFSKKVYSSINIIPLSILFKRMFSLACNELPVRYYQRLSALKWMVSVILALDKQILFPYLNYICRPICLIIKNISNQPDSSKILTKIIILISKMVLI